ncbi:uncharacterized protein EI97DRAFT_443488 [Westerdykella ornata]|uniref:Uncharacterized protein n=1 Tax=Westerdykella ornata TaxID=318751 RepID=A0A6A6JGB5_WESOR|nr:uncharacterized protein EI97DRAFT_443488 [Westerdykella ornata]KAF2275254.1 hypothetical protein EI97DRAFT_443488 [Westerdykella ornata]
MGKGSSKLPKKSKDKASRKSVSQTNAGTWRTSSTAERADDIFASYGKDENPTEAAKTKRAQKNLEAMMQNVEAEQQRDARMGPHNKPESSKQAEVRQPSKGHDFHTPCARSNRFIGSSKKWERRKETRESMSTLDEEQEE